MIYLSNKIIVKVTFIHDKTYLHDHTVSAWERLFRYVTQIPKLLFIASLKLLLVKILFIYFIYIYTNCEILTKYERKENEYRRENI